MSDLQPQFADALAELTANLVGDIDSDTVLRMVTRACVDTLGAAATGVMLVDPRGGLDVVAASNEHARLVELLQTQTLQGPCLDCIHTGGLVEAPELDITQSRWPDFVPTATALGFRAVVAVPMRLHGRSVGGLNLLYTTDTTLAGWQRSLVQALADLAVLGLVQEGDTRRADRLTEQTLTALNDRAHLAQAAGLVAGASGLDPHAAVLALVAYAHQHNYGMRTLLRALTDSTLDPFEVTTTQR